ncbi:MAG TPA: response regulator [Anaerolineaceae bacterium]|nr:response regulator [Anaerolineaceae bacterium]
MTSLPHILVIDDEIQILRALKTILSQQNYQVSVSETGEEGLAKTVAGQPDLLILDLGLPDITGVEVTRRLRQWSDLPILILSAHDNEAEKVAALDAGADDYLTKPFGVDELLARIRVGLRHHARVSGSTSSVISLDYLTIDLANHLVTRSGEPVKLTATEFKLLSYLAKNSGRVLTHQSILNHVWGYSEISQMEYLRIYIRQLRQKLEKDPRNPKLIITESGVGYRLIPL